MKIAIPSLIILLAAGFVHGQEVQVKPKSKKITELKYSGRIQGPVGRVGVGRERQ